MALILIGQAANNTFTNNDDHHVAAPSKHVASPISCIDNINDDGSKNEEHFKFRYKINEIFHFPTLSIYIMYIFK